MKKLIVVSVFFAACSTQTAKGPDASVVLDAAVLDGSATCSTVCARAAALKCPVAQPTPAGMTCEALCAKVQRGVAPWRLDCRTTAVSCVAQDACEMQ